MFSPEYRSSSRVSTLPTSVSPVLWRAIFFIQTVGEWWSYQGYLLCSINTINNHSFFAIDSLIFGSTDALNCEQIRDTSFWYAQASGQVINLMKSSINFSPNMTSYKKCQVFVLLSMFHNESHDIYPGLPTRTNAEFLIKLNREFGTRSNYGK